MSTNIVQRVFQEVAERTAMPIQSNTPKPIKILERKINENDAVSNLIKSTNYLGTPSKNIVKSSNIKQLPVRIPKTPQPQSKKLEENKKNDINIDSETEIKVFLRIRPLSNIENHAEFDINGNIVTAKAQQKTESHYSERNFTFTDIFHEDSEQKDVFSKVAMPLLRRVMHGFDGLLFAYGATSAGKTFTIRGTKEKPGLLPKMIQTLLMTPPAKGFERGLFVSCVEVYNERIHDLLGDGKTPLRLGKDGFGFTVVKSVKEIEIKELVDLEKILISIDSSKKMSTTSYNLNSSRSHCIFLLKLITIPLDPNSGVRSSDLSQIRCSRLSIVDLAGSERVNPIEKNSKMVAEACNINKSMLVLGRCIREVRKAQQGIQAQIPFRESKLTELFRDFFDPCGRKTSCSIIVNISPSTSQFDDTLFSLQFAAEAVECNVRGILEDENYADEEFELKSINFDEEKENKVDLESLQINEAKLRQEIHAEMVERVRKIHQDYQSQVDQIRTQSAQPYTSKLQQALAQKMQNENKNKELEELKREREREQIKIKDLENQIVLLKDELEKSNKLLKESLQKNAGMENAIARMIEGTKKLHQKHLELQNDFDSQKIVLQKFYENKIKDLENQIKSK